MDLRFAEVLAEGHVRQFRLLLLYLEQSILDRVLDDEFYRGYGTCLSESMLRE